MLHTPLCDLLGIEHPVIQAGMGPFTSARLVAAVSDAGGLGSLGAGTRTAAQLHAHVTELRRLTDRPFAINHTVSNLDEEAFEVTLAARPAVVSFALSDPGELVERAHRAGAVVVHQVTTVAQARAAAANGVDVVIAQGGEAGGFGGRVAALVLVPQVVRAVHPVPVVASGGIADGHGLAAALCLGAQGVNIGTRFLVTPEAPVDDAWKEAVLAADAADPVKVDLFGEVLPGIGGGYRTVPRALPSPFTRRLENPEEVRDRVDELRDEVATAIGQGRLGELVPFCGQTAGMISELVPAGEVVRRIVAEAERVLDEVGHRTAGRVDAGG
ncbi:MAG TPA: nitronate monooxygenase [Pseudonocardia sp.]|nr:nitronate monooxygenase [Pseudonocardia sp.]